MMARANIDAASTDFMYDVFLSFRLGTRYGFTDHLYRALRQRGINTFRDDENLRVGDEIRPALLEAIEKSRMSMVVLCENYASSTWCLDELVKITDCYESKGKQVYAIFYKVEPSDVRYQKNSYHAAMIKHEKRYGIDSDKVKAWRSALSRVCDLRGEHCRDNIYESQLIEKIAKDTSAKLPSVPLQINPVIGLDSHFEQVKPLINIDSNDTVCMLGIYGVGGIGKTTFAVNLYNKIRHQFEAASFLANVREKSNKSINGLEDLQKTLLSEMGEETQTVMGSTFKGGSEIKSRLGHKRVLLVLDDVDTVKQLESLAGGCDWFGSGSRIIITTRDMYVLDKHVLPNVEIKKYKMEELSYHESLELFCSYAFNMSSPAENFEDVSICAVSYAKGIPLALKVIGSNLKGESVEDWETELDKYRRVPNAEIQGVLEISYNSLSELDQKIFLDITCFFKGERWEYVKRILDACDFCPVIRVFINKCLINLNECGCLEMHDLIQDMGREIVRKESPSNPGERSRLWSHKDILEVLQENSGSSKIEGIMLDPPQEEEVDYWVDSAFKNMKNLRILIVRSTKFSLGPTYLPNRLRLLDWAGYPSDSLPTWFNPNRITDFNLPFSCLMSLEKPFDKKFEYLTFINLSNCQFITQIPDMSRARNLKVLTLDNCTKLIRIDESIGTLPKLVYLSASNCITLKSFVPRMHLPSLEELSLNFCQNLEHFPHVVEKTDKPLKIHMVGAGVQQLPHSIGNLIGLEYIDMSICRGLKNLPSSFLLLPKLVTLKITKCSQLGDSFKRFKESHSVVNGFPNLKTLCFKNANLSDEDLHIILEIFPKLEDLTVSHNDFVSLPESIKKSCLKSLDVSYCEHLQEIPQLPLGILKITARCCQSLTSGTKNMLWSKVSEEKDRIEVVMPKMEIPEWFDHICKNDIPFFWARRKFPVVAIALGFGKVNDMGISGVFERPLSVGLHLFIEGKEIFHKDIHYFNVGEEEVLFCDLRVLFNDVEWQGLNASLGDDWKVIQVQFESKMILTYWGVYVYKQETHMGDIEFRLPTPNSSKAYMPSLLNLRRTPEQRANHFSERFNLTDVHDLWLNRFKLFSCFADLTPLLMRISVYWDKASASKCGASLKQQQESLLLECQWFLETVKPLLIQLEEIKRVLASAAANGASCLKQQDKGSTSTQQMQGLIKEMTSVREVFDAIDPDTVKDLSIALGRLVPFMKETIQGDAFKASTATNEASLKQEEKVSIFIREMDGLLEEMKSGRDMFDILAPQPLGKNLLIHLGEELGLSVNWEEASAATGQMGFFEEIIQQGLIDPSSKDFQVIKEFMQLLHQAIRFTHGWQVMMGGEHTG